MGLEPDNKISDPSYYEREESLTPVMFTGNLAKELGIDGTFSREQADRLFRGMHPELRDGKEAKLTQRIDKDRVGAVDWTVNMAKPNSIAALVGGDRRIIDAFHQAVLDGVAEIERQARTRVRKAAEVEKGKPKTWKFPARYTDSLLCEIYTHPSSRSGDPNLHAHIKIYNLTKDPVEGRVKALELRFADREAVNNVIRKSFKQGLNQLGYKTKGTDPAIVGFPAEVKGLFSSRHQQIERLQQTMEAKIGKPMGSKAKSKLSLYDRPDKAPDMPLADRRRLWRSQLTDKQLAAVKRVVGIARAAVDMERFQAGIKKGYEAFRTRAMRSERETGRTR